MLKIMNTWRVNAFLSRTTFFSLESIHMNYPQCYPQGVDNLYVYPQAGVDKMLVTCLLPLDILDHFSQLGIKNGILLLSFFHRVERGNNGGVVSVKELADLGAGHFGNGQKEIRRNVPRVGGFLGTALAKDVFFFDVVFFVNRGKDLVHGYLQRLAAAQKL